MASSSATARGTFWLSGRRPADRPAVYRGGQHTRPPQRVVGFPGPATAGHGHHPSLAQLKRRTLLCPFAAGSSAPSCHGGTFTAPLEPAARQQAQHRNRLRGVRMISVYSRSDAAQLAGLVARADAGTLIIDVAERRPLTDLAAIHDEAVAGTLPGKIVMIP